MTAPVKAPQIGRQALTGAAWMVGFKMCSRLLGVASTLVLARLLTTADFGIVAIAVTISAGFNQLSNVGVTENLIRHKEIGRDVLDTGFTIQVIRCLVCGGLVAAAAPFASAWYGEPRLQNVMLLLGAAFALAGFDNVGIVHFRREMRFDREFQLSAIERVAMFIATLSSALLLHNYWALVIGTAVAKTARVAATYVMHPYRPRLGLRAWHELAGFSLWMWLSSLAYIVWQRADPLVIGAAVSKTELGIFVVAVDIALLPATEILEPIAAVLFAGFAAERNAGGDPRRNAFRLAVTLMAIMGPLAVILSASSTFIVGVLLGAKWSAAAPIVAILTFSVLLSPFSYTASIVLTAIGKLRSNLAVVTLASATKLVLLSVAAQTGNLHLIALAALSITSVESSLFIIMLRRNGGDMTGLAAPLGRVLVSCAVGALAMQATGLAWGGAVIVPFLRCVVDGATLAAVGTAAYAGTLLALWAAAGRPNGPERQILAILLPMFAEMRRRLTGLVLRKPADII